MGVPCKCLIPEGASLDEKAPVGLMPLKRGM